VWIATRGGEQVIEFHFDQSLSRSSKDKKRVGRWKGAISDGKRTALIACPTCGEVASISQHEIDTDGKVTPSVVCPFDGCDFHAYVKLVGWTEEAKQ
jgi:hypothetical protein